VDDVTRLTQFSHGAGCACKLGPMELGEVLARLPGAEMPPEVLVSGDTKDDAAVYRLPNGGALVQTLDFFTPIVDDPFDWGRVAAANALSDVYAMGGRPVLALNIVGWPRETLPLEMLSEVLRGGASVAAQAGVSILGGHTIDDPEPKYGMAVTGFVDEDRIVRNSTAPVGATLILTKPLGIGVITTAIKRGLATDEQIKAAVEVMATLNRDAADAMVEVGAESATDVTGFGLLGHLSEMLEGSGVAAEVDVSGLRFLDGAIDLAQRGAIAGGTKRNHTWLAERVDWGELGLIEQYLLADAQTSGGLLIATTRPDDLRPALTARGIEPIEVGRTVEGTPGRVRVGGRVSAGLG
jgi:selenide,water dikinase